MPCSVRVVIVDLDADDGEILKAWVIDNVPDLVEAIEVADPMLDYAYRSTGIEPMEVS